MHKPLFACVLGQSCTSLNFEEPRFFTQACQECAFLHASPFSCKLSSACHCAAVDKKVVTFPNTLEKLVTCESESNDRYLSLVNYGLGKETPASFIFFHSFFFLFRKRAIRMGGMNGVVYIGAGPAITARMAPGRTVSLYRHQLFCGYIYQFLKVQWNLG